MWSIQSIDHILCRCASFDVFGDLNASDILLPLTHGDRCARHVYVYVLHCFEIQNGEVRTTGCYMSRINAICDIW